MFAAAVIFCIIAVLLYVYVKQPKFGASPKGRLRARLARSPHYKDGKFHNLTSTSMLARGVNIFSVLWHEWRHPPQRARPAAPLPALKTDIAAYAERRDFIIWLGHSSCYMQLSGVKILIDPVFSKSAAPVNFANRAFSGTNLYSADLMPEIDYLLISHDHWDHLDYPTLKALRPKIRNIVAGLGMSAHFRRWGFAADKIHELDWGEVLQAEGGLSIHAVPSRHSSGRLFARDKSLWTGYALIGREHKILFSSDTGYSPHFAEIGKKFGGFDIAMLDMGQYDPRWPHMHMTPEEAAQAAVDARAQALLPIHIARFALARHAWDEPFARIIKAAAGKPYQLLLPKIGEPVLLAKKYPDFPHWWEGVE